MATPAELIAEQIVADVTTSLAAITAGADYFFEPDAVVRVDQWSREDLDASHEYVLFVRDTGDEFAIQEEAEFGEVASELQLFVLAARLDKRATKNPYKDTAPIFGTIRNRMIRDVKKKLLEDTMRSALATTTAVPEVTREIFIDGWVLAELRVVISYTHAFGTP